MGTSLQVNGPHSLAQDNDFSAHTHSTTNNHIYLNSEAQQGEYSEWMRKIGSLLQVGNEHASLKPILELIVAVFEPERLFVINHPPLQDLGVESLTEILFLLNDTVSKQEYASAMLSIACFRNSNVVIHIERASKVEINIEKGHLHYSTFCREEHLVFSNSPYRLAGISQDALIILKEDLKRLTGSIKHTDALISAAEDMLKTQRYNLAACILHKCLVHIYKCLMCFYIKNYQPSNRLKKLHTKVEKFVPQVCSQISLNAIEILDDVSKHVAAPLYEVNDICNVDSLFEDVKNVFEVSKSMIERLIELYASNPCGTNELEETEVM